MNKANFYLLLVLTLSLLLLAGCGCGGEDGDDGSDGSDGQDGNDGNDGQDADDDDSTDDDDDDTTDDDDDTTVDDDDDATGPTADAGADQLAVGYDVTVNLDGSASVDATSYSWTQTGGPTVTLTGANTATPSFDAVAMDSLITFADEFGLVTISDGEQGAYTFELTVSDGTNTDTDTVTVTSATLRGQTKAVGLNTTVYLNGGATLDGDTITAWDWTVTAPDASESTFTTQVIEFVVDQEGMYEVSVDLTNSLKAVETMDMTLVSSEYKGAGVDPNYSNCGGCHNGSTAPDQVTPWKETAHATFFARGIDGEVSDHYGESCLECHTVGYDLSADNNGFDDVAEAEGWEFPEVLEAGNWADMKANFAELAGLGNIQCEACHGPAGQHVANFGDADYISTAWDSATCGTCHMGSHHPQYPEWSTGAHAGGPATTSSGCRSCHTAEGASGYSNPDNPNGIGCVACHDPHADDNPHQLRAYGSITFINGQSADIGVAASCVNCHKGRRDAGTMDLADRRAPHHSVQGDMIYTNNFFEVDPNDEKATVYPPYTNSVHRGAVSDGCVYCHMESAEEGVKETGGHTFMVKSELGVENLETCQACHPGLAEFDRVAYADYDGDGVLEGTQSEVEGLMELLHEAFDEFLADGVANNPSAFTVDCSSEGNGIQEAFELADAHGRIVMETASGFEIGDCNHDGEDDIDGASYFAAGSQYDDAYKAAFNLLKVEYDGSRGIHNAAYAIQLLQRSYHLLTGEPVPNAAIR